MILCAGESLIDMVPNGESFRPHAGGAVYNTAIALGRLGQPTGYLWPISRDQFGEPLLAPLTAANVDTTLCPRSDRLTTLAFVTLTNGEAKYAFYDEGSAGRMFSTDDLPDLPATTRALFIGGISLVPDPCGATIEALVQHARARGITVMIDPNIRPFFITQIPEYRQRLQRLIANSDLVKLSADDLEWLSPEDPDKALAEILTLGPQVVFRTNGSAGAEAHWAGDRLTAQAQKVTVADTIGAGDTFNAGVLAALDRAEVLANQLQGMTAEHLQQALELGIRAAAVTVSRPGANPPWHHEL